MLLAALTIILGLSACGKGSSVDDLSPDPTIVTDRDSLGFGQENGSGTYLGTSTPNSLQVENRGQRDLVIENVSLDGDSAFSFEGPDVTTVHGGESALITVYFAPTEEGVVEGTLTIDTNDAATPHKQVGLSGKGITPPAAP
jgi:hypothetical protein